MTKKKDEIIGLDSNNEPFTAAQLEIATITQIAEPIDISRVTALKSETENPDIFQAADEYLQREKDAYAERMKVEREAKIAEAEAPTINIEVVIE